MPATLSIFDAGPGLHQLVHGAAEGARIAQQRGDVAEHDAGLGIVRDACGSRHAGRFQRQKRSSGSQAEPGRRTAERNHKQKRNRRPGGHVHVIGMKISPAASGAVSRACRRRRPRTPGAASVDWMCSAAVPLLVKPCLMPAGHDHQLAGLERRVGVVRPTSASPSSTCSTSSTACRCVGAP